MLTNNRQYLKEHHPLLYQNIQNVKDTSYQLVPTKNSELTLVLNVNGKEVSYHSRYNPIAEAEKFIAGLEDLSKMNHVVFIGIGLGYHLKAVLKKYPDLKISIFEPNKEVLSAFLNTHDLTTLKRHQLIEIFSNINEINNFGKFMDYITKGTQIITLPLASRINATAIEEFSNAIKSELQRKKQSLAVDSLFQIRWIKNSIINLNVVMRTPNLFLHTNAKSILQDKPVVLVAAGPSLDYELENLKIIKERGLAYIFAVGSAVNALIYSGIIPDAVFSYDPTEKNAQVVDKIKEENLPIPLVFGSSVGYETLQNYSGKMIHFITNQDSISHSLLEMDTAETIPDAPSIAVIALYILAKLQTPKIILVGQNLGFESSKSYAKGIEYIDPIVKNGNNLAYSTIKDVNGNDMLTAEHFLAMKQGIENAIRIFNYAFNVINTTKNGAHIEGTTFVPLSEVMQTILTNENIVDNSIFKGENDYSTDKVLRNYRKFEDSFDEMFSAFKQALDVQGNIIKDYERGIYNKVETYFNQFDQYFSKLESTDFFKMVIGPVTRVQYKELVRRSSEVKQEHLPRKKMEKFIEIFSRYMRAIYAAVIDIQSAFVELKKSELFKEGHKS